MFDSFEKSAFAGCRQVAPDYSDFDSIDDSAQHVPFSYRDAELIAKAIAQLRGVKRVDLYGSIARHHVGNDIDLLIVVEDKSLYDQFVKEVNNIWKNEFSLLCPGYYARQCAIRTIWKDFPDADAILPHRSDAGEYLDMFVMPQNWRSRIEEIQGKMPHNDPQFVRNISKDAYFLASP
jgi:Nucleotidyltransferase domain